MELEIISEGLEEYLQAVVTELSNSMVVVKKFDEIAIKLPSYMSDGVLHRKDIEELVKSIEFAGLSTEPKLSSGFIERGVDTPLILYLNEGVIDLTSSFYKHARLVVQVAVIMARADRDVDDEEIKSIEGLILKQKGINKHEQAALLAKAKYFLAVEGAYDEKYRDYVKLALSKESSINKMSNLSSSAKHSLLEVAKEVAIADGYLDRKELVFIQEIYRVLELPVRKAKKDIEDYAKARYVNLTTVDDKYKEYIDENVLVEIDDVLGELLSDFDGF